MHGRNFLFISRKRKYLVMVISWYQVKLALTGLRLLSRFWSSWVLLLGMIFSWYINMLHRLVTPLIHPGYYLWVLLHSFRSKRTSFSFSKRNPFELQKGSLVSWARICSLFCSKETEAVMWETNRRSYRFESSSPLLNSLRASQSHRKRKREPKER